MLGVPTRLFNVVLVLGRPLRYLRMPRTLSQIRVNSVGLAMGYLHDEVCHRLKHLVPLHITYLVPPLPMPLTSWSGYV